MANKLAGLIMRPAYDIFHTTTLYTCIECDRRVGTENHHDCKTCKVTFCVDCVIETDNGNIVYINCPYCKKYICSGAIGPVADDHDLK